MSTQAKNNYNDTKVLINSGRVSYFKAFEPYVNDEGKEGFSTAYIFPKSDLKAKAEWDAAYEAAKKKGLAGDWKGRLPDLRVILKDGDVKFPNDPNYKGMWFFNANAKVDKKPAIVDQARKAILDKNAVVSGDYCRISINFFPYDAGKSKDIGVGLNGIQLVRKGEPLGYVFDAEAEFADFDGGDLD